jgi:hypothetical protein
MRISKAAFDLIIAEEIGSKAQYEKKYQRPEWPGASSGVTVGIGYDLGQTDAATIRADWAGRVDGVMLSAMAGASGVTGPAAQALTQRLHSRVLIPWVVALAVHEECVLPRWEAKVLKALPSADKLPPDSLGALVSLTFNRGPSFATAGSRYTEMRAIKAHMAAERWGSIPAEFRKMKRLWPDLKGLRDRRDREAALFEKGLKTGAWPSPAVAVPAQAGEAAHVVTSGGALNLREGAGTSSRVITRLKNGTPLDVLAEVRNGDATWKQVRAGGKVGWVDARYISA